MMLATRRLRRCDLRTRTLVPRSVALAFTVAVLLVPVGAIPLLAAEPQAGPIVDAAQAFGLECDEYEPEQWLCSAQNDDRYIFTSVADFGDSFQVQSGRNRFDTTALAPAEADLLAHFEELITLSLGDDPEAQGWLEEMNAGPQASGELVRGSWTLTWRAEILDLTDPPVPSIALDLFYFPDGSPPDSAPSLPPLGDVDPCSLLTEAEVESITGLPADAGTLTRSSTGSVTVCSFGTKPWNVEVFVVGDAADNLDEAFPDAERIPDLGDLALWFSCGECITSQNYLMVVVEDWLLEIALASTTFEAEEASVGARFTHRDWAVALARLMIPRLPEAIESTAPRPIASATPMPQASEAPIVAPDAPSTEDAGTPESTPFADAVPTVAEVSTDPIVVLQSAALAALLVFLMPFPSQLFNSTLESHEDEVRRWFRLDRIGSAIGSIGAFWASWPGVALFTLLAAVLYGFLDPGFGLDLGSLATFLGMLFGIVLVTAAFAIPVVLAHRRHGDRPSLKVVPVSLLIGVACVLLSRLTDFQPGYLYGLLIGLAFARELSAAEEGRATAIGAALMLAVAFGAWLALSALPDGEAFGLVVARTALAALMVAGLEGVVFGLLPMRFLPGEPLYVWNRLLWGGLLIIGAFAFFHILINPASGYLSDSSRTPLFTVVVLLLGFSFVSVAFWAWFRFRASSPAEGGSR